MVDEGEGLAGLLAQGGADLVYETERTRVRHLVLPDGSGHVVSKEFSGPDAWRRLRHERSVLERLADVDGVVRLSPLTPPPGVILLQALEGEPLASLLEAGALSVEDVVRLAPDLATVIAGIHRHGVIHKDLTPANVMLVGHPRRVVVIDFDLAVTLGEERPDFTHHREISGTLAYMSPEQTGRTSRVVDRRTDLYGLGATLYALVTGRPPFGHEDPLQLIHDHLTRPPVPPVERNPDVPPALSEIILRLMAKEPDARYQSAEGVLHDLSRMRDAWDADRRATFALGERDFPERLTAPSRPVGRDAEITVLAETFQEAAAGARRTVVVAGVPGVGKTVLLNELRPLVTRAGGLFVTGRFDQFHQEQESDGVQQALRRLGRLLLAEPAEEIGALRERLLGHLGANAGLAATAFPEFAVLLDLTPEATAPDPLLVAARLQQVGVDILRAVASPKRPVVLAVDDLQWATSTSLGALDGIQLADDLAGVLVLVAYRENEVDAAHPLTALLTRWEHLDVPLRRLHLDNLPPVALNVLLGEMLRLAPQESVSLAEAVGELTGGNPFDTVELLNALRHEGALTLGRDGWHWDGEAVRRHIGDGDVVDLLTARMGRLPATSLALLDVMSCLGGEVTLERLAVAAGLELEETERHLDPALASGLLVANQADESVAFRHDRVQQAAVARLEPAARQDLLLAVARRLAAVHGCELFAAEPYLHVLDAVTDPGERARVVELFRSAASHSRLTANHWLVERYVAAAVGLVVPAAEDLTPAVGDLTPEQAGLLVELATDRHTALYCLGRLAEADEVFARIRELTDDPLRRAEATWSQISSLTNRDRPLDAVHLALDLLRGLGVRVPGSPEEFGAEIGSGMQELYRWATTTGEADDLARPGPSDPRVLAIARTINRTIPPAFYSEQTVMTWMILQAARLWAAHGPAAALIGPLSHASFITTAITDDYRTGNAIVRRVLAVGEARGYDLDTAQARFTYSLSSSAWFEPVEEAVAHAHRAHEELVRGGEPHFAGGTYYTTLPDLLDCALTLDELRAEAEAALIYCQRTGNHQALAAFVPYRQFALALSGRTQAPGSFTDSGFDEAAHLESLAANPVGVINFRLVRALGALMVGDIEAFLENTAGTVPFMPFIQSTYLMSIAHVLQALALAHRARTGPAGERDALLEEFDGHRTWLAARAEDAPGNFRHLLHLLDAERAWAVDDFRTAIRTFDEAQREVSRHRRPWHQGLILERAAEFNEEYGIEQSAEALLVRARARYQAWGAVAKVRDIDRRHPAVRGVQTGPRAGASVSRSLDPRRSETIASEEFDLIAVLKATQALASETDLDRLLASVTTVLSALSGASSVRLLLWSDEAREWFLPAGQDETLSLEEAAAGRLVPLSAFRYAERTRELLVVDDATRDDRFCRDPYLADLRCCSLLVVPVLARGELKAMLLLENRTSRAAFSPDRLDGVQLIAGQLVVSLDNAMLSASLERRVAQRVEALGEANERLVRLSNTDPLTGLSNRRHLDEALADRWRGAAGTQQHLAVLMIDIDVFKKYNDRYGHQAGDQCLRSVAAALRECVRTVDDVVARYGGEEFIVVLPRTDCVAAGQVAQRIRDAVLALGQPHEDSPHGVVTVSVGVAAAIPSGQDGPGDLVEQADRNLYEAKRSGRNRVTAR